MLQSKKLTRPGITSLVVATMLTGLVSAQTQVLATQDNWVGKNEPDATHPTHPTLGMRGPMTIYDAKEVFMRFDVPSAAIQQADLSLYRYNLNGDNTLEIAVMTTSTDIDTVTWNTRPTAGIVVLTTPIASGSGAEVYDLTAFVSPGSTLVLRLRLLDGDYSWGWGWFFSRENSDTPNRPYLVLSDSGGGPGTQYCCANAGSCNTCPCGNDNTSPPGACAGCAHSASTDGASLWGTGEARLSADTLQLHVTNAVPYTSVLFMQGRNNLDCWGAFLGDGLRCAGGNVKRLQVKLTDANGDASTTVVISDKSAATGDPLWPADTRYYQAWFRDTMGPCWSGSNTTNGYEVTWLP